MVESFGGAVIYGFVHGSDYKSINPLREVETLLAAMIGKWISHLEEQRSMLKMSNNDTEPGAVRPGPMLKLTGRIRSLLLTVLYHPQSSVSRTHW